MGDLLKIFATRSPATGGQRLTVMLDGAMDVEPPGAEIDLAPFASAACRRVRQDYPIDLYRFARESGLLDLPGWLGRVTAYWFAPLSEKSALRAPLIEQLYELCLVEAVIQSLRPNEMRVATFDDAMFRGLRDIGRRYGVRVETTAAGPPQDGRRRRAQGWRSGFSRLSRNLRSLVRTRLGLLAREWRTWWRLRRQAAEVMDRLEKSGRPLAVFYTRYPVLWEFPRDGLPRERNVGTLPEFLKRAGYDIVYAAVLSEPSGAVADVRILRAEARRLGIVFLESLVSFQEFVGSYLDVSLLVRYLRWRWSHRRGLSAVFGGLDVCDLALRQCDRDFLSAGEILGNYARAYAYERFARRYRPAIVFHPFEYQPMERAVYAGVKSGYARTVVVGLQTGMFSSNRPSWYYGDGEVSMPGALPAGHASLFPDYLSVYGSLARSVFESQCPPERILATGPIRYPDLGPEAGRAESVAVLDGVPEGIWILLGGSIDRDETLELMRAGVELAEKYPEAFLLIKFHHHNPMHTEWARMAEQTGCDRARVFEVDLRMLLRGARVALLGSSTSLVVEAISHGCMPVVLQSPERYAFGCAVDVEDAVFICADRTALVDAVGQCIAQAQGWRDRCRHWAIALERLASPLDGRQNERLFEALRARGAL